MMRLLTVRLQREEDVVIARQRARQIAGAFGVDAQGQTRVATAVSEISRNAFRYASGGTVEFSIDPGAGALAIVISDKGPGIGHLASILEGSYRSRTGLGVGIVGTRRLVDDFAIRSTPGQGTVVRLVKILPQKSLPIPRQEITRVAEQLARQQPAPQAARQDHALHAVTSDPRK